MSANFPSDEHYIREALRFAGQAGAAGEVPVGALVVLEDKVIGAGWNRPIGNHDPTAHAEIVAMRAAADQIRNYRLTGSTLYVTLEPCLMCLGAMIHARVERLVFAAHDPKVGATRGTAAVQLMQGLNHELDVEGGVLESESAELLKSFFRGRRD